MLRFFELNGGTRPIPAHVDLGRLIVGRPALWDGEQRSAIPVMQERHASPPSTRRGENRHTKDEKEPARHLDHSVEPSSRFNLRLQGEGIATNSQMWGDQKVNIASYPAEARRYERGMPWCWPPKGVWDTKPFSASRQSRSWRVRRMRADGSLQPTPPCSTSESASRAPGRRRVNADRRPVLGCHLHQRGSGTSASRPGAPFSWPDRSALVHEVRSKSSGCRAIALIRSPFCLPRMTCSPRLTHCNTVWRETPSASPADGSDIARAMSLACRETKACAKPWPASILVHARVQTPD